MHNNPYCPPEHTCPPYSGYLADSFSVCRPDCDTADGVIINPDCPTGMTCAAPDRGIVKTECSPTRYPPLPGPKQLGEPCGVGFPPSELCDGAKGLTCRIDVCTAKGECTGGPNICFKACDPRQGLASNPSCSGSEECVESYESFLQGVCAPPTSRKLGQWCNTTDQRCEEGLTCYRRTCYQQCDSDKGSEDNPDCGAVPNGFVCGASRCMVPCDWRNGTVSNPDCPAGYRCSFDQCERLPPPPVAGPLKLGVACGTAVDGCEADLICLQGECRRMCDPRDADPSAVCGASHSCRETPETAMGGVCVADATQQNLGEWCHSIVQPCASGLSCFKSMCIKDCDTAKGTTNNPDCPPDYLCDYSRCRKICDRAQGWGDNPACPVGTYCSSTAVTGEEVCAPSMPPPFGAKQLGASCEAGECDGSKGLVCDFQPLVSGNPYSPAKRCVKACDPRQGRVDNAGCPSGQECLEAPQTSFLQGICIQKPSRELGQWCDRSDLPCKSGLDCFEYYCRQVCDPTKGELNNPDCPAPQEDRCKTIEWKSFEAKTVNVCVTACDGSQGAYTNAGCPVGMVCTQELAYPSYCRPTSAPEAGTIQQAGAPCLRGSSVPAETCDWTKNLFCLALAPAAFCEVACDPHKGASDCLPDQLCIAKSQSFKGGYCL